MDSFTLNKIAGGILGTALFVMVVKIGAEAAFHTEPPEEPAYIVEGVDELEAAATEEVAVAEVVLPDFGSVIPAANLENGQMVTDRCAICHSWVNGAGAMIGPNLFGVVGRAKAGVPGFNYSAALQGLGGDWTYAELYQFLEQPTVYAPGTTMGFAGIDREQDRIDLIAFMRTWADNPAPLPPPMPAAEPAVTPAEGEAPPADAAAEGAPAPE